MYTNSNDNKKLSIVFMSNKPDISSTLYNVALSLLHSTNSGSSFEGMTLAICIVYLLAWLTVYIIL